MGEQDWQIVPAEVLTTLFLDTDPEYRFKCVVCHSQVVVSFARCLSREKSKLSDPGLAVWQDELEPLNQKYGGVFQPTYCSVCRSVYLAMATVEDRSWGSLCATVEAVWKVSKASV